MDNTKHQLPAFTYGSIDGIVTTFAVVSASAGANLDTNIILILGIANILSDGFSMACSSYLSFKTVEDVQGRIFKYSPSEIAIITFISFVVLGIIPLIAFVIGHILKLPGKKMYPYSYFLTFLALFWVGYKKGVVLNHSPLYEGIQSLTIGGIASFISYIVGKILKGLNVPRI